MAFEAHDPSPSQIDLPVFSACLADIYLEDWEEIPPCTEMRETIEWIEAPSHFPLRVFSIAASLVMFGTAIARQYSTPYKKGGTSLYVEVVLFSYTVFRPC